MSRYSGDPIDLGREDAFLWDPEDLQPGTKPTARLEDTLQEQAGEENDT